MPRKTVEHACEGCGNIRLVSPDKLAKGLQKNCRKCQGPAAAQKRREAMLLRGGPKPCTYGICKECRNTYQLASIGDDGYCCESCRGKGEKHTERFKGAVKAFLFAPPPMMMARG